MALTTPTAKADPAQTGLTSSRPVLIGFADALAAPETAWSLLEAGMSAVAFARRGSRPPLRCCRAIDIVEITAPERDLEQALADLRALARTDAFAAVMPLDDTAVWLCDAAFEGSSLVVAGPTGAMAELALDKRIQLEAAARAGLDVPVTTSIDSVDDVMALTDFPVQLKPALPVADRANKLRRGPNYVCANRAELEAAARAWNGVEPLLAQPRIKGVGEGLFGLAGPNGVMAVSAHRRIRMMNPAGSGSSACSSSPVDSEVAAAAARMLSDVGWTGLFMLEFLRADDETLWFMELNGRPWGSMALARRAGFEYPAWAIEQLRDPDFEPPPIPPPPVGRTCRHLGRELVHLLMVLRGPDSPTGTAWPSRRQTMRAVLRFSRNDDWYNWRRGEVRLFLYDAVGTVLARVLSTARS